MVASLHRAQHDMKLYSAEPINPPPDLPLPKSTATQDVYIYASDDYRIPVCQYMNIVEEDSPVMNTNFRHAECTKPSRQSASTTINLKEVFKY